MSVVLTGDIHQYFGGLDQAVLGPSESAAGVEYARIAAQHGVKVTLFVTGRAIVEDGADLAPLVEMPNVEIGGHGWDSLQPRLWHGFMNRVLGSPHGPLCMQRRMVRRTCSTIEAFTSRPVRSWRNHAYRYDTNTPYILADAGIRTWSDDHNLEQYHPYRHRSGVTVLPINTLPDHENLYHGMRTPEFVAADGSTPSYDIDVWLGKVRTGVKRIVAAGGVATVLAHPACMKIADEWTTFKRLCGFLSAYESLFAEEIAHLLSQTSE